MSNGDISDKNIQELLFYLNNVKIMDRLRILQVDVVILVIWSLLALIASFSETFLNLSTGSDFTIIIWIITLVFGGVITIFLKEQVYLTFRPKFKFANRTFLFTIGMGIIIAVVFDYLFIVKEIIFPLYSVLLAIYTYSILNSYFKEHASVFRKNMGLVVPIFSLISGVFNIIGSILEELNPESMNSLLGGNAFATFESIIFIIFLSPAMLYIAWYNHKQINSYIENIEIED